MRKIKMNVNCLLGYRCPECHATEGFLMATEARTLWYDDGTSHEGKHSENQSIDEDGWTTCDNCGHHAETADFDIHKYYVKTGGRACPYCCSFNTQIESLVQTDVGIAWQERGCCACGADWQDQYTLTGLGNFPDDDFLSMKEDEEASNE